MPDRIRPAPRARAGWRADAVSLQLPETNFPRSRGDATPAAVLRSPRCPLLVNGSLAMKESKFVAVPGSERVPVPGAKAVAAADAEGWLEVTLKLARQAPLPALD